MPPLPVAVCRTARDSLAAGMAAVVDKAAVVDRDKVDRDLEAASTMVGFERVVIDWWEDTGFALVDSTLVAFESEAAEEHSRADRS